YPLSFLLRSCVVVGGCSRLGECWKRYRSAGRRSLATCPLRRPWHCDVARRLAAAGGVAREPGHLTEFYFSDPARIQLESPTLIPRTRWARLPIGTTAARQ